jgi:hypothetical protein
MTGSTSNSGSTSNENVINVAELVNKYSYVLELYKDKEQIHINNLAVTFEICISYIKNTFSTLEKDIKILAMYVVKELYFKQLVRSDSDMITIINDFVAYYNANYISFKGKHSNSNDMNVIFGKEYIREKTRDINNRVLQQ